MNLAKIKLLKININPREINHFEHRPDLVPNSSRLIYWGGGFLWPKFTTFYTRRDELK